MRSYKNAPLYAAAGEMSDSYLNTGRGWWSIIKPANKDITNFVINPSFEAGNRNFWHNDANTNNAVLSIVNLDGDPDYAYDKFYALRVDAANPNAEFGAQYAPGIWLDPIYGKIPINEGQTLYASAWVKVCPGVPIFFQATFDDAIGAASGIISRTTVTTATGQWQRIKTSITLQRAGPLYAQIRITIKPQPSAPCSAFLIDAISMTDVDVEQYFDGDTTGASWTGAPYGSTSVMSRWSREFGEEIFLEDLGFRLISQTGHGMVPMNNDTIPYAQGGGAYYNRSWPTTRTITLVGQLEAKYGIRDLSKVHARLVELVGLHRYYIDPQPFILRYRLTKGDRDSTGVLEIPVVYKAGLEGTTNNPNTERITLQLDAYEDVFWRSPRTYTAQLSPNAVMVCYRGTAPGIIRATVEGQTVSGNNVDIVSIQNLSVDSGIYFLTPPVTLSQGVANNQRLIVGELDKFCTFTYLMNMVDGSVTSVNNHIKRPDSSISEFVLLNGDNQIAATYNGHPGITPKAWISYRERFLSATDVWRFRREQTGNTEGKTSVIDQFRSNC